MAPCSTLEHLNRAGVSIWLDTLSRQLLGCIERKIGALVPLGSALYPRDAVTVALVCVGRRGRLARSLCKGAADVYRTR
jgi:hypothetical protein